MARRSRTAIRCYSVRIGDSSAARRTYRDILLAVLTLVSDGQAEEGAVIKSGHPQFPFPFWRIERAKSPIIGSPDEYQTSASRDGTAQIYAASVFRFHFRQLIRDAETAPARRCRRCSHSPLSANPRAASGKASSIHPLKCPSLSTLRSQNFELTGAAINAALIVGNLRIGRHFFDPPDCPVFGRIQKHGVPGFWSV